MNIQIINTGSGANARDGDSLRSAFIKVNNNFTGLLETLSTLTSSSGTSLAIVGSVPPQYPTEGLLWFDDFSGMLFVYYDSSWVAVTLGDPIAGYAGSRGVTGYDGSQGETGFVGSQGYSGSMGYAGSQGDIGYTGSTGTAGINALWNYTSEYNFNASYAIGDLVTYEGQLYYRKNANYGAPYDLPTDTDYWEMLASKGDIGPPGPSGGYTGSQGIPGVYAARGYTGSAGTGGGGTGTGYTGSQGDIGYTGSGINGTIDFGKSGKFAYYSSTGTILSQFFPMKYIPSILGTLPALQLGGDPENLIFSPALYIVRNGFNISPGGGFGYRQYHDTQRAVNFAFYRARGTSEAPTDIINGDQLANISFGAQNTVPGLAGSIVVTVAGTPTTPGQIPGRIQIATNDGNASYVGAELSSSSTWKINKLSHLSNTFKYINVSTTLKLISSSSTVANLQLTREIIPTDDLHDGIKFFQQYDSWVAATFSFVKSRGTSNNPTAVQLDDKIGRIGFVAHDGTSWQHAAGIEVIAAGEPVPGLSIPTKIVFGVNSGEGGTTSSFSTNSTTIAGLTAGAALSSSAEWQINKLGTYSTSTSSIIVSTGLVPDQDNTRNLGSTTTQWLSLYANTLNVNNRIELTSPNDTSFLISSNNVFTTTNLVNIQQDVVVINATTSTVNDGNNPGLYIAPARNNVPTSNILYYNTSTKEITYGSPIRVIAPTASTSTGITGQIASDATYLYVCVDTNTWVRSAIVGGW